MNEQALVLERVVAIGEDAGYVVAVNSEYSNTGRVKFLDDSLDIKFQLSYAFQTAYYSVTLIEGASGAAFRRKDARNLFDLSTISGRPTSEILTAIKEGIAK